MDFLNAYTFGFCEKRGFTKGRAWKESLRLLAETTGCNAVILPVCAWQDHAYSVVMDSDGPDVMNGDDVKNVCEYARSLHLKIILKAMVNCRDGYWRAYIRFFDNPVPVEPTWDEWFSAWTRHVCMVAEMAAENEADMFCIGCEMVGTDHREKEWREIVRRVRQIYRGPLTYNCDKYQEDRVAWWDALDLISSSGYYPVDDLDRQTIEYPLIRRKDCVACGRCYLSCYDGGHQAIRLDGEGKPVLDAKKCVGCQLCRLVCPVQAIGVGKRVPKP